ncbi:MAG: type II toxin-antitoxin system VapC family toxin [Rickettsiales bacterium]
MSAVLDASTTIAWCYEDEQTPAIIRFMSGLSADAAYVPAIWRLEVANALRTGVRRGRISIPHRDKQLHDLTLLNIVTDLATNRHAWGATVALADRYELTPYDACYLELAIRLNLPLATLDAALAAAAKAAKIKLAL